MSGDSLSVMSPTTLVPRARDEENHFPARLNEADQKAKSSSIGGYRNVNSNNNKVLLTNCTLRCLHKPGTITA